MSIDDLMFRYLLHSPMIRGCCCAIGLVASASSCTKPNDTPLAQPELKRLVGMDPDEHSLFSPRGEPERLLGLAVTLASDGQFIVATDRAPGCEVAHRKTPSQWNRSFVEDAGHSAIFAAGIADLANLRTTYGKSLRVQSSVENVETYAADLRGPCGAQVITAVFVGTGWREVQYAREGAAKVGVGAGPVNLEGGGAAWNRAGGRLAWSSPQAWGFRVGSGMQNELELELAMPSAVVAGTEFTPQLNARRSVWLVVINRDALGNHSVVLPAAEVPSFRVEAGQRLKLPTMIATNLPGHRSDHEALLVYGFAEEGDYKMLRPPAGALTTEEANSYVESLTQRLIKNPEIPRSRWTSTSFNFAIVQSSASPQPAAEPL